MDIGLFLGAFKYIPTCFKTFKEKKNDNSRIGSYEEGRRRIQQLFLPLLYVLILATIIIPILVPLPLIWGYITFKTFRVLKNIKMMSCDCGHLLTRNDNFSYNVEKKEKDKAIVTMDFVCCECQKPKHLKCEFTLITRSTVAGYKDETVYKAEATKDPGVYEIHAETRKVAAGYDHHTQTPEGVINHLFNNHECLVKEIK